MKKLILFTLLAAVLALSAQSQSPPYQLIDLGALPGDVEAVAFDINDPGQIVGSSGPWGDAPHAVLWDNGTITDLGTLPGYDDSEAYAINNLGEIVGGSGVHAVLWKNGAITDLGMPPGYDAASASGINERGQIIGTGSRLFEHDGLLWDKGTITVLEAVDTWFDDDLPIGRLGPFAHPYGINERGQVVGVSTTEDGVHAVLWENGTVTDLGALPGHNYSEAFGINNRGQIMGLSGMWTNAPFPCDAGACNAVLWEDGTIRDLGIPMSGGGGINDRGQIVFTSFQEYLPEDSFVRPVLWDNGTITDLGEVAAPGSGLGGAFGINDRGQIVGFAVDVESNAALWTR